MKQKQREERKSQKPWRNNMKSVESQDSEKHNGDRDECNKSMGSINTNDDKIQNKECNHVFINTTEPNNIDVDKKQIEQPLERPWRKNMKRSSGSGEGKDRMFHLIFTWKYGIQINNIVGKPRIYDIKFKKIF